MRGNKFFKFIDRYIGVAIMLILKAADIIAAPVKKLFVKGKKNILIIKFSAMGDTVLLMPVIKKIKETFPESKLIMVVTRVNIAVVEKSGLIDEVMLFEPSWVKQPFKLFAFLSRLLKKDIGIALDFDQWLRISAIMAYMSGAIKRIGFQTRGQMRHFLYTDSVAHGDEKHETEVFFDIVWKIGIEPSPQDKKLFFEIDHGSELAGEKELSGFGMKGKFIVMHPGCGSHGFQRQWPEERYAEVARHFMAKGYDVVISIGSDEERVYDNINMLIGQKMRVLKEQPLRVLAYIIKKSSLFISGNTGVMHLAASVDTPLVAIHGPTNYLRWGPPADGRNIVISSNMKCSPCLYLGHEYGCRDRKCMEAISAGDVIKAAEKLLTEG
jgi:heptosyltransferase I